MTQPAASPSRGADRRELDRSLVRSVAWTGSAKLVSRAVSWASTLVLGRFLQPSDYGLVAMAGAVTGLVQILSEFGIGQTIVTLRELSDEAIEQLNGLSVLIGVAACAFAIGVSRPAACSSRPSALRR